MSNIRVQFSYAAGRDFVARLLNSLGAAFAEFPITATVESPPGTYVFQASLDEHQTADAFTARFYSTDTGAASEVVVRLGEEHFFSAGNVPDHTHGVADITDFPEVGGAGDPAQYFFPFSVNAPLSLDTTGSPCNSAGEVRGFGFYLPFPVDLGKLAVHCDNGGSSVGAVAFAVYGADGQALLWQSGGLPVHAADAVNSVYRWTLPTPLVLDPGPYFFCQTANEDFLNNFNGITCVALSSQLRVLVGVAGDAGNPIIVRSANNATPVSDTDISFPASMGAFTESSYQPVACYFHV